jgi:uncharacterized lipoprotein YajG
MRASFVVRRLSLVVVIVCAPLAFARGNLKELTVPLKFVPQEGVHASTASLPPGVLDVAVEVRVEDARKLSDLLVIGSGTGGDDKPFPIHADREVRGFIQDTLTQVGKEWSLKQEAPAARKLLVQITGYAVDESNKAVGSMYSSDTKLAFTLTDAQGKTLATGTGVGSTHRYGRAHSADNINEVLSDALKEAYANVLADPALQAAWVSGKPGAGAKPAESAEERLRKLEDLYKKGLITKDEYQTKRADILKDM